MNEVSPALSSYFQLLLSQKYTLDCRSVNIVVDNAHIPVHGCSSSSSTTMTSVTRSSATSLYPVDDEDVVADDKSTMDKDGDDDDMVSLHERMSRSLSDIPTVSFPPAFLLEDPHSSASSRWESFNAMTAASSDLSLAIPHRTRDLEDEVGEFEPENEPVHHHKSAEMMTESQLTPFLPPKRSCLRPTRSLDSTDRLLLRDRSWDTTSCSSHTCTGIRSSRARSTTRRVRWEHFVYSADDMADRKVEDKDWASSLRSFDLFHIECGPSIRQVVPGRMLESSLQFLRFRQPDSVQIDKDLGQKFHEERPIGDSPQTPLQRADGRDVLDNHSSKTDERSFVAAAKAPTPPKTMVKNRWTTLSPATIVAKPKRMAGSLSSTKTVEPSNDWTGYKLDALPHRISPRTLARLPLPLSLVSSTHETRKYSDEEMEDLFRSTGCILGITSGGSSTQHLV
jgi:hypothetical protein